MLLNIKEIMAERRMYQQSIGVYFLFYFDELVYVGSSTNLDARLASHNKRRRIKWNSYVIIECDTAIQALRTEHLYIKRYLPKHNQNVWNMDAPEGAGRLVKIARTPSGRGVYRLPAESLPKSVKLNRTMRRRAQRRAWWVERGVLRVDLRKRSTAAPAAPASPLLRPAGA